MKSDGKHLAITLIAAIVIIVVAMGSGYYIFDKLYKRNMMANSYTAVGLDPYKGWKSYSLKHEKLTFMYPPTWSINDSTDEVGTNIGVDVLAVNGPGGFQIAIQADRPIESLNAGGTPTVLGADKLTFLGNAAYMVYTSFSTVGSIVNLTYLNASPTNTAPQYISKHDNPKAVALGATQGNLAIVVGYTAGDALANTKRQSLASARNDPNYLAAKSIIESMHY